MWSHRWQTGVIGKPDQFLYGLGMIEDVAKLWSQLENSVRESHVKLQSKEACGQELFLHFFLGDGHVGRNSWGWKSCCRSAERLLVFFQGFTQKEDARAGMSGFLLLRTAPPNELFIPFCRKRDVEAGQSNAGSISGQVKSPTLLFNFG